MEAEVPVPEWFNSSWLFVFLWFLRCSSFLFFRLYFLFSLIQWKFGWLGGGLEGEGWEVFLYLQGVYLNTHTHTHPCLGTWCWLSVFPCKVRTLMLFSPSSGVNWGQSTDSDLLPSLPRLPCRSLLSLYSPAKTQWRSRLSRGLLAAAPVPEGKMTCLWWNDRGM